MPVCETFRVLRTQLSGPQLNISSFATTRLLHRSSFPFERPQKFRSNEKPRCVIFDWSRLAKKRARKKRIKKKSDGNGGFLCNSSSSSCLHQDSFHTYVISNDATAFFWPIQKFTSEPRFVNCNQKRLTTFLMRNTVPLIRISLFSFLHIEIYRPYPK